jgi:hypothetical protein
VRLCWDPFLLRVQWVIAPVGQERWASMVAQFLRGGKLCPEPLDLLSNNPPLGTPSWQSRAVASGVLGSLLESLPPYLGSGNQIP